MDRATVEKVLVRRLGRWSAAVGFDVTNQTGSNVDHADAIATTILAMGFPCADPTNPTDSEVATAAANANVEFFARAELRHLDNIIGNWADPNEQAGINRQEWGRLLEMLIKRRDGLAKQNQDEFGPPGGVDQSIVGGRLDYDFQRRYDDQFITDI